MLNIADTLRQWCRETSPFALATIVDVSGSAPLPRGTALAVDRNGNAVGNVSGGCVDGAVYDLCRDLLDTGGAPGLVRFGYSDDDAFAVGLTCGGEIEVLVQRVDPAAEQHLGIALDHILQGRSAAVAQVVDGPQHLLGRTLSVAGDSEEHDGTLGGTREDEAVASRARALLRAGRTASVEIGGDVSTCPQRLTILVHTHVTRPRMLIFGAVDFAAALSQVGHFLGYHVTVCDARSVFTSAARFPYADQVVVDWPHRYLERTEVDTRTVICALTHDSKFDVPLLHRALALPVGYVGALGSRRTHEERLRRLRDAAVPEDRLVRLHSPIGLDLGAHTPEETAISIAAEIIARTHGATGLPLSQCTGPIHQAVRTADRTFEEESPSWIPYGAAQAGG